MEYVIALLVLGLIVVVAFVLLRPRGGAAARHTAGTAQPPRRETTLSNLRPGDALVFWDNTDRIVASVLRCQEELRGRSTQWQWAFLDDGRLIEAAPDGIRLFGGGQVIYQGSAEFEQLVPPSGALAVFEERVRAGEVGRNPVFFDLGGQRYRLASTGTFASTAEGEPLAQEVWRDLSANPSDNVFFELELVGGVPVSGNGAHEHAPATGNATVADEGVELLGIWTTHIWLGRGKRLTQAEIAGLYGKG
ncbi:MAG: hypothetical protein ACYC3S_07305 [Chloroflexota bacterium]